MKIVWRKHAFQSIRQVLGFRVFVHFLSICREVFTRGVAPWWSGERMQHSHMKHVLLYNQSSLPLVVSRENAASTHEA